MIVICFYWDGDRWFAETPKQGGMYDHFVKKVGTIDSETAAKYINILYRAVSSQIKDVNFVCFTNLDLCLDSGVDIMRFNPPSWVGVLPRLYAFSRESGLFGERVLMLDIDLMIVGSLKNILSYNGKFCTLSYKDLFQHYKYDSSRASDLYGGIVSFDAGQELEDRLYSPFKNNPDRVISICQGRERYLFRHAISDIADTWSDVAPGNIVSYKRTVAKFGFPRKASIVAFHGNMRPHKITNDPIINKYWWDYDS